MIYYIDFCTVCRTGADYFHAFHKVQFQLHFQFFCSATNRGQMRFYFSIFNLLFFETQDIYGQASSFVEKRLDVFHHASIQCRISLVQLHLFGVLCKRCLDILVYVFYFEKFSPYCLRSMFSATSILSPTLLLQTVMNARLLLNYCAVSVSIVQQGVVITVSDCTIGSSTTPATDSGVPHIALKLSYRSTHSIIIPSQLIFIYCSRLNHNSICTVRTTRGYLLLTVDGQSLMPAIHVQVKQKLVYILYHRP